MKHIIKIILLIIICTLLLSSCESIATQVKWVSSNEEIDDPHSFSKPHEIAVKHLNLTLNVDFEHKILSGCAEWTINKIKPSAKEIFFDSYDLIIDSVILDNGAKALYSVGKKNEILGAPLTIKINDNTQKLKIYYQTSPEAAALQWLSPQQTFDKQHPFLFTQGESIYTRTWIPCQDAPQVRFTYNATIAVPNNLLALMSASNPQSKNKEGVYKFEMKQAIPAYLVALAVGNLQFKSITEAMGVYAEPAQLEKGYKELVHLSKMMHAAEQLYGKYDWERYDVLFLPQGFPFGGMENPRLTFATPTILTGDHSLVNLIAHEMAHSWSGNLVTNATWNDFWLNESFTVYFERRIMEALEGKEYADMLWDLGMQDLKKSVANYQGEMLPFSKLALDLKGKDPDLGLTDFAYEKGAAMLLLIEQNIGRAAMDTFIRNYFNTFKFKSMHTAMFVDYISNKLFSTFPNLKNDINFDEWIFGTGLPNVLPKIDNTRFSKVNQIAQSFLDSTYIRSNLVEKWSIHEWLHFIRNIKTLISKDQIKILDKQFHLSTTNNAEIATEWFVLCINKEYDEVLPEVNKFIEYTGRMKFLEPIYDALNKQKKYKEFAQKWFRQYKNNYHPLAQKSVASIINS